MKRVFYALIATVISAGPSFAAGSAFLRLADSVSPAALENIVPQPPAPAPAAGVSATPITAETIKGEYAVRPYKFAELLMLVAEDVTVIRRDPAGDVVCKGVYKLDTVTPALTASFENCGGNSFALKIDLAGQTIETLFAGVNVMGSGVLAEDSIPKLPINIRKTK